MKPGEVLEKVRNSVNAGLEMLRKRQALLAFIDEGRRQLDEGEYTEYDEDGLRRRFEELQERIDRKASEKHAARQ